MAQSKKNEYRLGRYDAGYFQEKLSIAFENGPTFEGAMANDPRSQATRYAHYSLFDEEKDPFFFEVHLDLGQGDLTSEIEAAARLWLSDIIAMDDAAREIPDKHDQNEELAVVMVSTRELKITFTYYATVWNNNWDVDFRIQKDGSWECLGVPSWKKPGTYIR